MNKKIFKALAVYSLSKAIEAISIPLSMAGIRFQSITWQEAKVHYGA